MNSIKRLFLLIKNIFNKQKNIEKLAEPEIIINEEKNDDFRENLKASTMPQKKNRKVETLICDGDGLGIQSKLKY